MKRSSWVLLKKVFLVNNGRQIKIHIQITISLGATLCVFSHANVETTSSKGVHCSVSDA